MTRVTGHSKNVRLRDCPEDCDGNHKASVIDTQKLRQQLAEAIEGNEITAMGLYGQDYAALIRSMYEALPALLDEVESLRELYSKLREMDVVDWQYALDGNDLNKTIVDHRNSVSRIWRSQRDELVKKYGV